MDFRNARFVSLVLVSACLALLPMGCKQPPPITLTAEAAPPAIFPGEPVTVTATAGSVDPNKKNSVIYGWTGTGVTGNGASATVATATLAPGSYTVQRTGSGSGRQAGEGAGREL